MSSRDFCYWLQGYFEIQGDVQPMTVEQITIVRNHLNMVFKHEIDPSYGDKKHQEELSKIHQGSSAMPVQHELADLMVKLGSGIETKFNC